MMAAKFDFDFKTKSLRIAGLDVLLTYFGDIMERKIQDYICPEKERYDVVIAPTKERLLEYCKKHDSQDYELCEYMLTGGLFYTALMDFNGLMLHASAVAYDGMAYLFSAKSGTGKSTHTQLWCECFAPDAVILNDDKPALRCIDGEIIAYGTPWSGKTDLQVNMALPVAGIAFIERDENNSISLLPSKDAMIKILSQTIRPGIAEKMNNLVISVNEVLEKVSVYQLNCNMEIDAARVAYETMKK